MRTATLREFRDRASTFADGCRARARHPPGRIVGFFVPTSGTAVPLDIKRKLFYAVTSAVDGWVRSRGLSEGDHCGLSNAPKDSRRR